MTQEKPESEQSLAQVEEALRQEIEHFGHDFSRVGLDWLPSALVRSGLAFARPPFDKLPIGAFRDSLKIARLGGTPDETITELLNYLAHRCSDNPFEPGDSPSEQERALSRFAAICEEHGICFSQGSRQLHKSAPKGSQLRLCLLTRQGIIQARDFLAVDDLFTAICSFDRHGSMPDKEAERDPQKPWVWLRFEPEQVVDLFLEHLESLDDATIDHCLVRMTKAVRHFWRTTIYDDRNGLSDSDAESFEAVLRQIRELLRRLFHAACDRLGDDASKAPSIRRQTCLRCVWALIGQGNLTAEMYPPQVIDAANLEMAQLRKLCERATDPEAAGAFADAVDVLNGCSVVLFETRPLWDAIRPFLLALRSLTVPAVAPDLRYWTDDRTCQNDEQPPEPWREIPDVIGTDFHQWAGHEQESDETLHDLRTRFAKFCLQRLSSRERGGPPIEPSPIWRRGYIAAALELSINPGGRGHRMLDFARKHDPDEQVRQDAHRAYLNLRRGPKLGQASPRTAFFHAFWQLRKAHMLSLGQEIHRGASESTRDREVRRTTVSLEDEKSEEQIGIEIDARLFGVSDQDQEAPRQPPD